MHYCLKTAIILARSILNTKNRKRITVDRRKQTRKTTTARPRPIVVPASRRPVAARQPRREVLLATQQKPQVIASVSEKDLKPKPVNSQKPATKKRVTIDSFSPKQEAQKTAKAKPAPKKTVNHKKQPQSNTYTQQVRQQQHSQTPQYQPAQTYPVQSVQYHNHYYAQNAPAPQPVAQQPYPPAPQPSQYQRAVVAAQQQPQVPMPINRQYPVAAHNGAATLPVAQKPKKQTNVQPYSNSPKKGLAKIKEKMNRPDMKYKPSDIMRYAVVTFFVIMASYLAFDTWNTNQQIQNTVGDSASATDGQHASSADVENPPMENGVAYPEYQVADDMPRIVSIPSINMTSRVSEVSLTGANKIDVPSDASFTGWYNGSAKLDNVGAAFLTGHYNGANSGGVFDNLNQVENGAEIVVEMGDGSKLKYEVVSVENTPIGEVDMSRALSPAEGVTEGLNIMTCQGTWSSTGYSHRLTVYSKRV